MKSDISARIGTIDALTMGLTQVGRRPWLIIIPAAIDLILWLTPQLSVAGLLQKFLLVWEALLRAAYPPAQFAAMADLLTAARQAMAQVGGQINLAEMITGSWLAAPSVLAVTQATRLTLVSDMILAPIGLSLPLPRVIAAPWRPAPVEVTNLWAVLGIMVVLWLASQVLATVYLRWAAQGRPGREGEASPAQDRWAGPRGFLALVVRLALFSLILSVVVFMLRIPLALAATLLFFSGSAAAAVLFALIGGMTLWVLLWSLTSVFFVSETVLLDQHPLWRGLLHSLAMVRLNGLPTVGLVLVINLLMLGFRAVWGFVGQSPLGALVAILGNSYLATAMLLAVYTYYEDLSRRWRALLAQSAARGQQHRE